MDNPIDDSKQPLTKGLVNDALATDISQYATNPEAHVISEDQQKNHLEGNGSEFFAEDMASENVGDEENSLEERLNDLEAPSAGVQQVSSSIDSNNARIQFSRNITEVKPDAGIGETDTESLQQDIELIDTVFGANFSSVLVAGNEETINNPAIISGEDTGAVTEDSDAVAGNLVATGKLNISDIAAESSFIDASGLTGTGGYGQLSIDSDGNWEFTADNSQAVIQDLTPLDTPLTDTFTVTSVDGTSHEISISISGLTISATNNNYTADIQVSTDNSQNLIADKLTQNFSASTDTVDDDTWSSDPSNNFEWDFDGTSASGNFSPDTVSSSIPGITEAYHFDGSGGAILSDGVGSGDSYSNMPSDPTNNDASFELWVKAADTSGHDVLFESGGTVDGVSIRLNGTVLEFFVKDGGTNVKLSYDLSTASIDPAAEFFQVTGVIDTGNMVTLYVNGQFVVEQSAGSIQDWSGSNDAGLGGVGGNSINFDSPPAFEGDVASFRFYEKALTASEVLDNYQAMAEAPLPTVDLIVTGNIVTDSVADDNDVASFGPLTSDSLVLNFDAANDPGGDDDWNSDNPISNFVWDFDGTSFSGNFSSTAVTVNQPGITQAYHFDGTRGADLSNNSGSADALQDLPGNPTNNDASFEIWFRADDTADHDVLFESGASGNGASIRINGTVLEFYVKEGNDHVLHTYDLAAIGLDPTAQFIQVVGVIAISGNVELYVNGTLAAVDSSGVIQDWDGGNDAGLGATSGAINFGAPTVFEGDIASFRFYEKSLTADEVFDNYQAVAGMAVTSVNGMDVSLTDGVALGGGTLFIAADGSFSFEANDNFTGEQQFTYQLENHQGDSDEGVITITAAGAVIGTSGNDVLLGTSGDDVIYSQDGTDSLSGGSGNDILVGGNGVDTFSWSSGDDGSVSAPAVDLVRSFLGNDILDFSGLLIGESADSLTLDGYLDFNFNGEDTIVDVKTGGAGSAVTQQVVLEGSDIASGGATDQAILDSLLTAGQLNTD